MSDITDLLREEHQALLPHIDELRLMADRLDEMAQHEIRHSLDGVYQFLTGQLIPHAAAEDEAVYPAVGKILDSSQATATMSRDHVEVSRLTEQLGWLRSQGTTFDLEQMRNLRRVLYGLPTLLKVHLAKEEEIYLPLLESHLSEAEAHRLLHKIAQLAHGEHSQTSAK
jgi:iron-sulfur cluster repair protein YtfE (RIC family)